MVLICDDDRIVRDTLTDILSKAGYRVASTCCGEEALQFVAGHKTRVVLLDINMPGENGGSVLRKLKQHDSAIDVIILTAYATVEDTCDLIRNGGAYTVIPKPPTIRKLITAIETAMSEHIEVLQEPCIDQEIMNNMCRGL